LLTKLFVLETTGSFALVDEIHTLLTFLEIFAYFQLKKLDNR